MDADLGLLISAQGVLVCLGPEVCGLHMSLYTHTSLMLQKCIFYSENPDRDVCLWI